MNQNVFVKLFDNRKKFTTDNKLMLSCFNAVFSLSVDKTDAIVYLIIQKREPIEMALAYEDPETGCYLFETEIPFNRVTKFPMTAYYNYSINGSMLYQQEKSLVVNRAPMIQQIVVNDSIATKTPRQDVVFVNFNVFYIPSSRNHILTVRSDMNIFSTKTPCRGVMTRNRDGWWSATLPVSVYAIQPICYKYVVIDDSLSGKSVVSEGGRSHMLFVHVPIGGTSVSVYDMWTEMIPGFTYVSRPLQPCCTRSAFPNFSLEVLTKEYMTRFFITGSIPELENDTKSAAVAMHKDGAWMFNCDIPANTSFSFQFGCSSKISEKLKWINGSHMKIHNNVISPNAIRARYTWGAPNYHCLCVYAPLVSLRMSVETQIGDFGTLVAFAMWAKQCGIEQIHIHIETLENHLLDPIHAQIDCEASEVNMGAIRQAKLASLRKKYDEWKTQGIDYRFGMFLQEFPWIKKYCDNEFALFVQCFLFQQMSSAYERIVDIGVQLITDFVVLGDLQSANEKLLTMSHFSHSIRIVGIEKYMFGLTIDAIKTIIGEEHANFVIKKFCVVNGNYATVNPAYLTPKGVEMAVQYLDPRIVPELEPKLHQLFKSAMLVNPPLCHEILSRIAMNVPCTLIMDSLGTKVFTADKVVTGFGMIPSSNSTKEKGHMMTPNYLSPEMISEFPADVDNASILTEIISRVSGSSSSICLYLNDLLVAFGRYRRFSPEPVQMIKNHCRFLFPATISDLQSDSETNRAIRDFIEKHQLCD